MKLSCFLLLAACSVAPLCAQTPAATAPASASHPLVKPVVRPPASAVPPAQVRASTAQRMAAMKNKPQMTSLPNFTTSDRDGRPVAAAVLPKSTHWLLVYRSEVCLPCDRLMNVLAASENSSLKSGLPYVILVAEKKPGALERVRANYSTLGHATWLTDTDNQAYAALKPRGTPMVYAMDGSKIVWSVPGNLGNPTKVEKMAADWVSTSSTSGNTLPTPK